MVYLDFENKTKKEREAIVQRKSMVCLIIALAYYMTDDYRKWSQIRMGQNRTSFILEASVLELFI